MIFHNIRCGKGRTTSKKWLILKLVGIERNCIYPGWCSPPHSNRMDGLRIWDCWVRQINGSLSTSCDCIMPWWCVTSDYVLNTPQFIAPISSDPHGNIDQFLFVDNHNSTVSILVRWNFIPIEKSNWLIFFFRKLSLLAKGINELSQIAVWNRS